MSVSPIYSGFIPSFLPLKSERPFIHASRVTPHARRPACRSPGTRGTGVAKTPARGDRRPARREQLEFYSQSRGEEPRKETRYKHLPTAQTLRQSTSSLRTPQPNKPRNPPCFHVVPCSHVPHTITPTSHSTNPAFKFPHLLISLHSQVYNSQTRRRRRQS